MSLPFRGSVVEVASKLLSLGFHTGDPITNIFSYQLSLFFLFLNNRSHLITDLQRNGGVVCRLGGHASRHTVVVVICCVLMHTLNYNNYKARATPCKSMHFLSKLDRVVYNLWNSNRH